uniref:PALP domain-containing protein n=1 Tax=Steinernema glaseri TaxID=37863 RepID=A0A1I7ZFR9_9BILA
MLVVGVGTGGTISGISKRVKEQSPKCSVVGVDHQAGQGAESQVHGGRCGPRQVRPRRPGQRARNLRAGRHRGRLQACRAGQEPCGRVGEDGR